MKQRYVVVKREENLCIVTVDRPPVNALNRDLMLEIESVFSDLGKEKDVRAVVLTGQGEKAFVAGADVTEVIDLGKEEGEDFSAIGHKMTRAIENCPVPVICAINGAALGGGCEIALACDIRIMAETAVIGLPEASLGLLPGAGGTQRLPKSIFPGMAKFLLFSASPLEAAEALRCGLVEKVVKREEVLGVSVGIARRIASNGPLAIKAIKYLVRRSFELLQEAGLHVEREEFGKLCVSKDKREGITAFLEKRKAIYTGS